MSMDQQGWGFPFQAPKAHYFLAGDPTSLCKHWAFTGLREDDHHDSRDNCKTCQKARLKRLGAKTP